MDHQSFRFYIPGIVFLTPIYIVICFITITQLNDSDTRVFVLVGGITAFPALALPVGWWIYNAYRVWWLVWTKGGYEKKDFVEIIRRRTNPFYCPLNETILIDFSHINEIKSWIKIDPDIFRKMFFPYSSDATFSKEIKAKKIHLKFTEALSDSILWKDGGYDYARSISSVRYGLESSVFAIFLGGIYAFGIKYIWLYNIAQVSNLALMIFWYSSLSVITVTLLITLFIRWKKAGKEYDSRLLLTTITSLSSSYLTSNYFSEKLDSELVNPLEALVVKKDSYAAFDLDNTLLLDDIGEAVFALMIKKNIIKSFSWSDYQDLIKKDRRLAYNKVIEVMNGLDINLLKSITHETINYSNMYIEIGSDRIPVPQPNIKMQALISLLKIKGIDVYVVTASNQFSAEMICWEYFGIPSSNVFGATVSVTKRHALNFVESEIPFERGKVNVLKNKLHNKPLITAGDGIWDLPLLDYTQANGLRLWLGQDIDQFEKIKSQNPDYRIYQVLRDNEISK